MAKQAKIMLLFLFLQNELCIWISDMFLTALSYS